MRSLHAAPMALEVVRRFRLRAVVAVVSVATGVAAIGGDPVRRRRGAAAGHGRARQARGSRGWSSCTPGPAPPRQGPAPRLTLQQVAEIERTVPGLDHVVPLQRMELRVQSGGRGTYARATGTVPDYRRLLGDTMAWGRFLEETDGLTRRRVCVLGADLAERLLRGGPPTGREGPPGRHHLHGRGSAREKTV